MTRPLLGVSGSQRGLVGAVSDFLVSLSASAARTLAGLTEAQAMRRRVIKTVRCHLTDLCGVLNVEWRRNWQKIGIGHFLGDVEVDEQVKEAVTSKAHFT